MPVSKSGEMLGVILSITVVNKNAGRLEVLKIEFM